MEQELNIPFIELARVFQADKISTQYRLLGQAIGAELCDKEYYEQTMALIDDFRESIKGCALQWASFSNCDPIEMSLALIRYGFKVAEIFGTCGGAKFRLCEKIAQLSPETKIYSNLSLQCSFMSLTRG